MANERRNHRPVKVAPKNCRSQPRKKSKTTTQKKAVIQSCQSFIPIKDIREGIIVTEDNRYVRIVEFTPINFGLRSASEQEIIIDDFASMLKIAPCRIQFKSFSRRADREKYIKRLRADYTKEENEQCKVLLSEYMKLVDSVAEQEAISRRFFMIVEYDANTSNTDFLYIASNLNATVRAICARMRACGNEIVHSLDFTKSPDVEQLEVLYELLNRKRAETVPFAKHYPQVVKRYMDYTGRDYRNPPFIPVKEFFAPRSIDITSSKHVVVDGKYYTFAYLAAKDYNNAVYGNWLAFLTTAGDGIDVDVFLRRLPKAEVQRKTQQQIRLKRLALNDTEDTNSDYDELHSAISSAFYVRDGLANNEDLYYMSVLVTIVGDSAEDAEWKFKELNSIAISYSMKLTRCLWQQEQAFLSALPLARLDYGIEQKARRNMLTSAAAASYIYSSFELCDEDGILFGVNQSNRSLAMVDIFNTARYSNANMAILGMSGSGKTFSMQCLATRMRERGIQVFIIPPLKGEEFKRACDNIGGSYVNISAGSPHCINIMEIRPLDEEAKRLIDGSDVIRSRLADKAQQIGTFVSLLVTDMSLEERQLVDEAIIRTYEQAGITNDNASLLDPDGSGRYREMPILEDLYNNLKANPRTERVANILNLLVHGSASSFNGRTNVDLDNKYVVLDVSQLTGSLLTIGMFVALDYVWDKVKEDRTKKKAVFLDELWQLIGASSNRMAAQFVLEIFKTIRGYGGAAVAATQDLNDFFSLDDGSYGKGIINNSQTKVILRLEKDEALFVQDVIGLTQTEVKAIRKFRRGNCLLITGGNNVFVDFKASPLEAKLITTEQKQLARIAEEKRLEEARQEGGIY